MLKQRLITAAILVPLVVWGVLALPTASFAAVFAVVVVLGGWEWAGLVGLTSGAQRAAYALLIAVVLVLSTRLFDSPSSLMLVFLLSTLWWLAALLWIRHANVTGVRSVMVMNHRSLLVGLFGVLVLVPPWLALVQLHRNGIAGGYLILLLMCVVWGADSGAYFSGRRWGRRRLAPNISPGKTWEGVYGGLAVATLIAMLGAVLIGFSGRTQIALVLLTVLVVLYSIVGDLFESMLKRATGIKDSGHLLPGHGGVLDRIDSITAAAPVFCLGLMIQGVVQ